MPQKTPKIRYSLKDRGRQYTGKVRNFNIRALFDFVNSDACQETVESRGMIGYYGHWPRVRFGMDPTEGGLDNGKPVPVEPAFVTTHLKMFDDGMVEHVAEFFDTASGKLAEKLFFDSKTGGFSSAIDASINKFYGFDYVIEPNFLNNSFRGVTLDDAMGGSLGELTYDDVYAAECEEYARNMMALLDSIKGEREASSETIERLQQDNEQLMSFLASHNVDAAAVLDSSRGSSHILVDRSAKEQLLDDVNSFGNETLPQAGQREEVVIDDKAYQRIHTRMNR
ncbi:hypothetical protein SAMN05216326_12565 [Nitrosomonas marina]|uniref:Uncharacterized protein n=1 Tax=Nitrosomonas marina TaxID=917 RepID=A0A1I0E966_9PROT|nr:hypothetical protein [Nitrosomonas marina]SET41399.1 hypothetical protein SAMN05216326_12565 [Nitrosomonas marina]